MLIYCLTVLYVLFCLVLRANLLHEPVTGYTCATEDPRHD